ncbi:hypothetical protein [Pandoraea sputorum]|uniref:Uncharacterized protein n=1 Tax=Pandoraea sputorum TaxID=93222 RepID=A0A5E5BI18_9BURK|nr:hypothetical protein [Pandoraea sputorum]VVE85861.1 hypothetical protein PSP31121_05494 [Pandoraea sputorum]
MLNPVTGADNAAGQSPPLVVPADLDFADAHALREVHQALITCPVLLRWCEQAFDRAHHAEVRAALATLILYAQAEARDVRADALLGARASALATLASRLLPAGQAALRQTLAMSPAPHPAPHVGSRAGADAFIDHLAERDRRWLAGHVCCQAGDAYRARGEHARAAADYAMAACLYESVPAQTPVAAALYRQAARAHQQANDRSAAAFHFAKAGALGLAHAQPCDAIACQAAVARAAAALAAAGSLYIRLQEWELAIIVNTRAAKAFTQVRRFTAAAALYHRVAEAWPLMAWAHRRAGEPTLADDAARQASRAYGDAAFAYRAANAHVPAAHAFALAGRHDEVGKSYVGAARHAEQAADAHQRAGQTAQAEGAAQTAWASYALAGEAYQRAAREHTQAGRHAPAAACLQRAAHAFGQVGKRPSGPLDLSLLAPEAFSC